MSLWRGGQRPVGGAVKLTPHSCSGNIEKLTTRIVILNTVIRCIEGSYCFKHISIIREITAGL